MLDSMTDDRAFPDISPASVPASVPNYSPGCAVQWLFCSRTLAITVWWCRGCSGEEKYQPWPGVSFVHSGAYKLRCPRGTTLVDSNQALLMRPSEPYQTSHPFGCGDWGSSLVLRGAAAHDLFEMDEGSHAVAKGAGKQVSVPISPGLFLLQRLLAHELRSAGPADPLAVEEMALRLCRMVVDAASIESARRRPRQDSARAAEHVEAAKELLHRRLPDPLQLADLAASLEVSPEHLCRLFKQRCGTTLSGYRNRLRLRKAVEALADGATDLTDLALSLGFSSHSHFSFAFRREFGFPPSQVRRLTAVSHRGPAAFLSIY